MVTCWKGLGLGSEGIWVPGTGKLIGINELFISNTHLRITEDIYIYLELYEYNLGNFDIQLY